MTYVIDEEDYISHYGIKRKSGRYPWGSGNNAIQRSNTFLGMAEIFVKRRISLTRRSPEHSV